MYEILSTNGMYEVLYQNGIVIKSWTEKDFPQKIDFAFKIKFSKILAK